MGLLVARMNYIFGFAYIFGLSQSFFYLMHLYMKFLYGELCQAPMVKIFLEKVNG